MSLVAVLPGRYSHDHDPGHGPDHDDRHSHDDHHHEDHDHDDHGHAASGIGTLASEQIELVSAGIDIGSATSHLMVSRLVLRRRGLRLSSGFEVVSREITYRSRVLLTPYLTPTVIDAAALGAFIRDSYAEAGLTPDDIDTGAVIVTGEAARKTNARAIANLFAAQAGRFVCAVAGPLLEARLAVQGSGAAALSTRGDSPVLNLDIGGGTTKVSLLRHGRTEQVMVVNVGARLLAWDAAGRLTRVEEAGRRAARACGFDATVGAPIAAAQRRAVAEYLADRLSDHLDGTEQTTDLFVAGTPFAVTEPVTVLASGGVGEFVYELETADYGDLGNLLGAAIRRRLAEPERHTTLVPAAQRLRSTVIGASQYTVQVSGNTIWVRDPNLLPLTNVPVAHAYVAGAVPDAETVAAAVRAALAHLDPDRGAVALALHTSLTLSYPALNAVAHGIAAGTADIRPATLAVLFQQDCAGLVGHLLRPLLGEANVLCVDQVDVADLDFVDLGRMVEVAQAVPVIAKSLIFSG